MMDSPSTRASNRLVDLSSSQSIVRRNVIIATTASAAFSMLAYRAIPIDRFAELLKTPANRVIFTLQCNAVSLAMPFIMVGHIGNTRFLSRQINPLANEDREKIEVSMHWLLHFVDFFGIGL